MSFGTDSLGLAGSVTIILRELIHERLGLFYAADQFDQLTDRLAPLVVARGLGSFMDYYYLLKYSDDADEWGRVMDALSVQETYFWREIDQIRAIVDHVVPSLANARGGGPLRFWSAPCATGEEPLTLAMLLEERGWFDRVPIEIFGSDASRAAIAKANLGQYGARSFRNLPLPLQEKYFERTDARWRVAPALHRRVTFDVVNLMVPDEVARHASAPVIFCRNVFIYFSDLSVRRTLETFARLMPERAYLCVGASESLLRLGSRFVLQEVGGAFVYVKDPTESDQRAASLAVSGERN
jgi:chemotaxis protein methyltransferase CheR